MKNLLSKWKAKNLQFAVIQGKRSGALKSHSVFQTAYQILHDSGNQSSHSETSYFIYLPHPTMFSISLILLSCFSEMQLHGAAIHSPQVSPSKWGSTLTMSVGTPWSKCSLITWLFCKVLLAAGVSFSYISFKISSPTTLNPYMVTYSFMSSWDSIFLPLNGHVKLLSWSIHLRKYKKHESKVSKLQINTKLTTYQAKLMFKCFCPQLYQGQWG